MTEADFLEKKLSPKLGKLTKNGQKQGLFNLLKNLVVNFYWICSIVKIYIISCVPAQIPYLGKFVFLRYGPKCSKMVSISLTFKCQSTAVTFVRPLAVARRIYEIVCVLPSVLLSVWVFSWNWIIRFP